MGSTASQASEPLFPSESSTLTIPGWLFGALTLPSRRDAARAAPLLFLMPARSELLAESLRGERVGLLESPEPSRRATLSATCSAAYSTAAEAMVPEGESVTLMGSHRTSHDPSR